MNKIEAVLLDMDGTIVDAFPPIIRALNQTFVEYGLPQMTAQEVKRHTGRGDCSMISLFGDRREEAGKRFLEIHDEDYLDHINPLAGAESLFQWLNEQGIPCAIVTSKSQSRAEAQFEALGWSHHVEVIIGKIDGRPEKPDPTPVLLACEALKIKPERSVMIGDGIADMKAASRAGSRGLGLCDSFSIAELTEAGASRCFNSLSEIHQWLIKEI
ncbi:phosphoglycolate phosphatase/sugar-phosphatase [Mariprofundus aestuarium]|uniref:phosphoglycolate phosphatase n=1 Tax=Mariprofundus aestuarium TaxID=1921086 RepID=A0A2K8KYB0_MARES|nr:HAD family hydrolase [Mariprofundus aestuarium]ATX79893.1 phosphoglycolate phosphatase/sugar-phosphatase [Mariprofundus aestuarium]